MRKTLTYHEVSVDFQYTPLFRVKESVLDSAHLEESLLVWVALGDFLDNALVYYLSRQSLHLTQQHQLCAFYYQLEIKQIPPCQPFQFPCEYWVKAMGYGLCALPLTAHTW